MQVSVNETSIERNVFNVTTSKRELMLMSKEIGYSCKLCAPYSTKQGKSSTGFNLGLIHFNQVISWTGAEVVVLNRILMNVYQVLGCTH